MQKESRFGDRVPYPTPTSKSPVSDGSGSLKFPHAFRGSPEYAIDRNILPIDILANVARQQQEQLEQEATGGNGVFSFDQFAELAAKAERSPVNKPIVLPVTGDHAGDDDNQREAATILMMVADDLTGPRRTQRPSRPAFKAASPSPKEPRAHAKRAKTAATPLAKAQVGPKPERAKRASYNLKGYVEGGIEGVTMAPQKYTYADMCILAVEKNGRPTRQCEMFSLFQQIWPYYRNMEDKNHQDSVANSIRHNLSLTKYVNHVSQCLVG